MKTIELFAGTCSFSTVAREKGHETFTTDNDRQFDVDLVADVRELTAKDFPYKPDIMWASPPCEGFSVTVIGRNWTHDHKPKTPSAELAQELVLATLRLIDELQPTWWFIENPRGKLRRMPFMCENETVCSNPSKNAVPAGGLFTKEEHTTPTLERTVMSVAKGQKVYRNTITYCQYGDVRQKPTDTWTNAYWWKPRPMCGRGDTCHNAAPRGSRTGTQGMAGYKEKSRIPSQVFEEIFRHHEHHVTQPLAA